MEVKTREFTFSQQAKRLPEILPLNEEFAYIVGLWSADRCSAAKGIVGLKNKDEVLLDAFRNFIKKIGLEVKEREVIGYGKTREVYCCSMPLRRIFEFVNENVLQVFSEKPLILAYLAGIVDGDGSSGDGSHLVIFYSLKEMKDVEKHSKLLRRLGFKTSVKIKRNHIRLYVLKPSRLIKELLPFLRLKRKFTNEA